MKQIARQTGVGGLLLGIAWVNTNYIGIAIISGLANILGVICLIGVLFSLMDYADEGIRKEKEKDEERETHAQ